MHQPAPVAQLGLLPPMYPFCAPSSLPEFSLGAPVSAPHLHKPAHFSNSWETRCLRKHRRRAHDEVCSAKRRRLMETEGALSDSCTPQPSVQWVRGDSCSSVAPASGPTLPCPSAHTAPAQPVPGPHSSCMEVEAAQRRLREIEDRITLEDDSDSELEVEVCPRRPVLVLSDSLKEGLQRGLSDILPHTVAQSVFNLDFNSEPGNPKERLMSHSCMELVLWRPPEDPLSHRLKESLQRQRRQQQSGPRQPPTPCPSPAPHRDPPLSPLYSCPAPVPMPLPSPGSQGEEAMEM
ncbi:coiled-coil domain-containing protein 117 isoform X2 [Boleophthalmus pectinirostris]|uniref:coiled-coil domain-containing protein 117 isoform X2 n=1 Tax=Boleophthalmus pectinirostris TaxID=150288 RepID=UPI00242D81EF|nr:coiled-coil domain-containing protein 117 isoform X2 [Boleophthalmus pectinirostris]